MQMAQRRKQSNPDPIPNPNPDRNPIPHPKPNPKRLFSPLRRLRCAEYRYPDEGIKMK